MNSITVSDVYFAAVLILAVIAISARHVLAAIRYRRHVRRRLESAIRGSKGGAA